MDVNPQPCSNCGRLFPESELSFVHVLFVLDGEPGTIEHCAGCADYILDTPEGELFVLEASNTPVALAWEYYH